MDTTSNGCGTGKVGDDVTSSETNGQCVSKSDCTSTTGSKGYIDGNKCSSTCSDDKVANKVKEVTIGSATILVGECIAKTDCINTVKGFVRNDKKECVESKNCDKDTGGLPMVGNNVADFRVGEMKGFCITQEACKGF